MQTRIVCEYSNAGDGFKSGPGSTGSLGGPAPPPQKKMEYLIWWLDTDIHAIYIQQREHSETANSAKAKNVIRDSNPDFLINLDPHPDICRIGSKML